MLGNSDVSATIPVSNMDEAKEFYEQTLGLTKLSENPGGTVYKSGNTSIFVYETPNAGTNQGTAATWNIDDVESTVEALKSKGVTFEHYDIPGVTREGDVHLMGPEKAAWFKDPSGNILCVGTKM